MEIRARRKVRPVDMSVDQVKPVDISVVQVKPVDISVVQAKPVEDFGANHENQNPIISIFGKYKKISICLYGQFYFLCEYIYFYLEQL